MSTVSSLIIRKLHNLKLCNRRKFLSNFRSWISFHS